MPRLDGMNPILLKTLISLAASNNKSAKNGSLGNDAQLRNRTILYPDEALDLPEWGIAGMPGMVLGAAPQTCLFVSDLHISEANDSPSEDTDRTDKTSGEPSGEIASFCLTLSCTPAPESSLKSCTIIWKLALPIAGYRDIQTSNNSDSVRAPVIHTTLKIGNILRDVEIGLLEMNGLKQPLLIGQDTLGDQFLIRPDRDKKAKPVPAPSVDLNPASSDAMADKRQEKYPSDTKQDAASPHIDPPAAKTGSVQASPDMAQPTAERDSSSGKIAPLGDNDPEISPATADGLPMTKEDGAPATSKDTANTPAASTDTQQSSPAAADNTASPLTQTPATDTSTPVTDGENIAHPRQPTEPPPPSSDEENTKAEQETSPASGEDTAQASPDALSDPEQTAPAQTDTKQTDTKQTDSTQPNPAPA
jgi:hypothetical protein